MSLHDIASLNLVLCARGYTVLCLDFSIKWTKRMCGFHHVKRLKYKEIRLKMEAPVITRGHFFSAGSHLSFAPDYSSSTGRKSYLHRGKKKPLPAIMTILF